MTLPELAQSIKEVTDMLKADNDAAKPQDDARILSQVRLTDRMRKFLSHPGTRTSAQHAIAFQTAFNLSPEVAGRLLAEFVGERD